MIPFQALYCNKGVYKVKSKHKEQNKTENLQKCIKNMKVKYLGWYKVNVLGTAAIFNFHSKKRLEKSIVHLERTTSTDSQAAQCEF